VLAKPRREGRRIGNSRRKEGRRRGKAQGCVE
jgi:hypothetical protein